jgi:hypothetical protein
MTILLNQTTIVFTFNLFLFLLNIIRLIVLFVNLYILILLNTVYNIYILSNE